MVVAGGAPRGPRAAAPAGRGAPPAPPPPLAERVVVQLDRDGGAEQGAEAGGAGEQGAADRTPPAAAADGQGDERGRRDGAGQEDHGGHVRRVLSVLEAVENEQVEPDSTEQ